MAFRLRHFREISRIVPRYFHSVQVTRSSLGTLNQQSRQGDISLAPFVIPFAHVWVKINQSFVKRWCQIHRFSTLSETLQECPSEVEFLTFFESTLDEPEGPHHCWLNKLDERKEPFKREGTFLVLAGAFLEDSFILDSDHIIMFARVKLLQRRYPQLRIFGFQSGSSICSVASQTRVVQIIMKEYITFPILLTNKKFSKITNLAGYLLFQHFRSPLRYYEMRTEFDIIIKAIEELNSLQNENFVTVQNLNDTGIKHPDVIKEPWCYFQNLFLYFPGCISVDEIGDRLFLSDSNHHRIIIFDCDGKILDCIGSSPGFEDGEFELAKLLRPAASFYHSPEDCLYFVDSENNAIRRAHLGRRDLETVYPTCNTAKKFSGIWSWILDKLGMGREVVSKSEEFGLDSLIFPWHLMKSRENNLLIINRSFQTLWIMDSISWKIKEVVTGYPNIIDICGQMVMEKVSLLHQIFGNQLKHSVDPSCSLEGLTYASMISSLATYRNDIIFCDTVSQTILKLNKVSGIISNFHFSNFGILGLPYWLPCPLERVFVGANTYQRSCFEHLRCFSVLPGRCDIQVNVDIPQGTELAAPLQEGCIWRQARGSATDVTGSEEVNASTEKVGVAQQWFDELDNLAFSRPGSELSVEDEPNNPDRNFQEDNKVQIGCAINISPGTSEVFIDTVLYLKLKRNCYSCGKFSQEEKVARILDVMNEKNGKQGTDAFIGLMLESSRDMEDLIFMKPLHLRVRLECLDQPTPVASKDIVLTDSTIEVNVSL